MSGWSQATVMPNMAASAMVRKKTLIFFIFPPPCLSVVGKGYWMFSNLFIKSSLNSSSILTAWIILL